MVAFLVAQGLRAQTVHTVQDNGFAFDPATVTINVGDSVKFVGSAVHPIVQVSEDTWNNNGITPLEGGFAFASGAGEVYFPAAGTFYYVCTAHVASQGMKGKIIVQVPASLNDVLSGASYEVYPVPLTGNELTVALRKGGEQRIAVEIYDLTGNLRLTSRGESVDSQYKVNCSSLPKGVFLMKVKANEDESVLKVVKP